MRRLPVSTAARLTGIAKRECVRFERTWHAQAHKAESCICNLWGAECASCAQARCKAREDVLLE